MLKLEVRAVEVLAGERRRSALLLLLVVVIVVMPRCEGDGSCEWSEGKIESRSQSPLRSPSPLCASTLPGKAHFRASQHQRTLAQAANVTRRRGKGFLDSRGRGLMITIAGEDNRCCGGGERESWTRAKKGGKMTGGEGR